ncbi:hypothetical protein [Streptomyces sp. NBC_01565]|uniref:hypothetical protein n=1 Tax=unclassified Streptomyces TaxID=2593676 RepID=UPI002251DA5F|nr:hypothetical protein [Streptomyces sp. NBC_01565]MCX4545842.1 hypothetical protein [Streptomyces sp. NBC_01565]
MTSTLVVAAVCLSRVERTSRPEPSSYWAVATICLPAFPTVVRMTLPYGSL